MKKVSLFKLALSKRKPKSQIKWRKPPRTCKKKLRIKRKKKEKINQAKSVFKYTQNK